MEKIENKIYLVRGRKVMLDSDLAALYGVEAKALNQAVKRNISRFPSDFMFRLTEKEFPEVYDLLDKDFPFYQDSYIQVMTKELAEIIKDDAQVMAAKTKTELH